jgi:type IV pilus assembly protein PilC
MPQFRCRYAAPSGEIVERLYESLDEGALRRELEEKDCLVLSLRRTHPLVEALGSLFRVRSRVSAREFLFFNQELAALLRAGLPILQALDLLLERRKSPAFRRALVDVRERVKAGEALSDAFAAQGDLFPRLYPSSLASGERSGELASVLRRFIAYQRSLIAVRRKVVQATLYPAILLALSIALVTLMVFYIIPKFNEFLEDFGSDLPLITRVLVDTATFCSENAVPILTVVGAVGLGFAVWRRSGAGRVALDRIKLKLPLVGGIAHDYAQNRFTRTLGTLVSGGIPLVTSLDLAARASGNALFERELLKTAAKVREGRPLWESLEDTRLFNDLAVEMVKVGESTGALDDMLDQASTFMDEEIDHRLARLVSLMEPIMLVFMACVVGAMLLAIYLPLIQSYGRTPGL